MRPQLVTDFHEAYQCASRQMIAMGKNAIGMRGTPVVSFWPMKEKWRKFGEWFTTVGSDGDVRIAGVPFTDRDELLPWAEEPRMLQLYYRRLSDTEVVQLAWVRPDWDWRIPRVIQSEKLGTLILS